MFLRILIVVIIVPIFFIAFFDTPKTSTPELILKQLNDHNLEMLFFTTLVGLILAYKTALPAKYFICPLILSAFLNTFSSLFAEENIKNTRSPFSKVTFLYK